MTLCLTKGISSNNITLLLQNQKGKEEKQKWRQRKVEIQYISPFNHGLIISYVPYDEQQELKFKQLFLGPKSL